MQSLQGQRRSLDGDGGLHGLNFFRKPVEPQPNGHRDESDEARQGATQVKGPKALFKGLEDSFSHMKLTRPAWWGAPVTSPQGSRSSQAAASVGSTAGPFAPSQASRSSASSAAAPEAPPQSVDNTAMMHHFVAIERLVRMGLSPQAAKVALHHLDDWVFSPTGATEMGAAEVAAISLGEPILKVGDMVQLCNLDSKNAARSGRRGTLKAYGAENQRWLVNMDDDGKEYWVRSKNLEAVEARGPMSAEQAALEEQPSDPAWNEACNRMLSQREDVLRRKQESLELREIQLLEREERILLREESLKQFEEQLRKDNASVEAGQQHLGRQRQSLLSEQARTMKELARKEKEIVSEGGGEQRTQAFSMCMDISGDGEYMSMERATSSGSQSKADEGEADEVWDMDWNDLATQKLAAGGGSVPFGRTLSASSSSEAGMTTPVSQGHTGVGSDPLDAGQYAANPEQPVEVDLSAKDEEDAPPAELTPKQPQPPDNPAEVQEMTIDAEPLNDASKSEATPDLL